MTSQDFLMNAWRNLCGLPDKEIVAVPDLESLRKTEWSPKFEQLMRNRLIMGAIRYGTLNKPGKPTYDRIASMIRRLNHYKESGNLEDLVDVANLALCEFEEGNHPNKHFKSIDDGEHAKNV